MTRDTPLSRGVIGSLVLTLMFGIPLTSVRADVVQPLPRPTATSTGDEARWLRRLPPATQPLPRPMELAQSGADPLQEALRRLESRVESGALAPAAPSAVETPAREPREPAPAIETRPRTVEPATTEEPPLAPLTPPPSLTTDTPPPPTLDAPPTAAAPPVPTPRPPVMPEPPVAPVPPAMPESIAPVSPPADTADTTPERTPADPSATQEKPSDSASPEPRTTEEGLSSIPGAPPSVPVAPSRVPSLSEQPAEATRAPLETAEEPRSEPADARTADTPEPAAPETRAGRWQVQLLAGRSLSRVERDRDDLLRFHGDRVAGLTLAISQAGPNGLYRLRALDWPSQAEAGAWCRRLRAATGLQCMVVRGDDLPDPVSGSMDTAPAQAR